jgi:hypothetical protein
MNNFKQNKYTNWYNNICAKSTCRPKVKTEGFELHHIVPRSLGGSNDKENLVLLTFKEHYICHLLLCKMLDGKDRYKMAWALSQLTSKHRITNCREFEVAREILSKCSKGIPKSDEWKKLMSERNKGENNPMHKSKGRISSFANLTNEQRSEYGRRGAKSTWEKWLSLGYKSPPGLSSKESIKKMTETKIKQGREGMLWHQTLDGRKKLSLLRFGKKQPESQKKKVSQALSKLFLIQTPLGDTILIKGLYKAGKQLGFDGPNILSHNKSKGFILLDKDFEINKYKDIKLVDFTN